MKGFSIFLVFVAFLGFAKPGVTQEKLNVTSAQACNFSGGEQGTIELYGFTSTQQAEDIIKAILEEFGLSPEDIKIKASNVENASATIINKQRYILYSESFLLGLESNSKDQHYWTKIGILAHEIGHHFKGHTLLGSGSTPSIELEADQWSGFALFQLGATLEQAQLGVRNTAKDFPTPTHPKRQARLEAIAVGFSQAKERESIDQKPPLINPPPTVPFQRGDCARVTLSSSYLAFRTRPLTPKEVQIVNCCPTYSNGKKRFYEDMKMECCRQEKQIDKETYLGSVNWGELIEYLGQQEGFFKVRRIVSGDIGFIPGRMKGAIVLKKADCP